MWMPLLQFSSSLNNSYSALGGEAALCVLLLIPICVDICHGYDLININKYIVPTEGEEVLFSKWPH